MANRTKGLILDEIAQSDLFRQNDNTLENGEMITGVVVLARVEHMDGHIAWLVDHNMDPFAAYGLVAHSLAMLGPNGGDE